MPNLSVVADYRLEPSEGMQVVSKGIVDALRHAGHQVQVIDPAQFPYRLLSVLLSRPDAVVFTHGPGVGVVLYSWVLRKLSRSRIIWVASRPSLVRIPRWLKERKTAHYVVCNRRRADLDAVARDAEFVERYIGIDPARVAPLSREDEPWPDLSATGRPVLLHVGHLKRNRGLEILAAAKRSMADKIEVVVQGSPTFAADAGVVEELESAGVRVRLTFESNLHRLYRAADLYVFPVSEASAGAIELPLGVLEAVACGTPVLTMEFGVLKQALDGVPGVKFCSHADFLPSLRLLLEEDRLESKPEGLPKHLHADRATETVLRLVGT